MKNFFTLMLAMLLGGIAAQAQTTDYQPLVREGVRWVNHSQFIYTGLEGGDYYGPKNTYTMEFSGDTVITSTGGTHTYKKLISSSAIYYLRESDKKVYCLEEVDVDFVATENLLYDFSKPDTAILAEGFKKFALSGMVEICGRQCRVYKDTEQRAWYNWGYLVESIGLVSLSDGDLVNPRWARVSGGEYYYGLDHVEDLEGNIIYKSPWYVDPSSTYQPLVREGIRWVYQESINNDETGTFRQYYALEIFGDTIIHTTDGAFWQYFKCFKFPVSKSDHTSAVNFANMRPVAYLKGYEKIFCIDSLTVLSHGWDDELAEPMLYDFTSPDQAILGDVFDNTIRVFNYSGVVEVGGNECNSFSYLENSSYGQLVQSIGFVSASCGDLLGATRKSPTSEGRICGLSHVLDSEGNIIYRGPNYHIFASDVTADGIIDIVDVNTVINIMLGKSESLGGDVTGDGVVDIADVNAIINVMLDKQ